MAWTAEAIFNTLNDGDLNGQGAGSGWSAAWSGGTNYDVQGTTVFEGAKAIIGDNSSISRSLTTAVSGSGVIYVAMRRAVNNSGASYFYLQSGSGPRCGIQMNNAGAVKNWPGAGTTILASYSANTWYVFRITFDTTAGTYSVDYSTAAYGSAESWTAGASGISMGNSGDITGVVLDLDTSGSQNAYFDYISGTSPYPGPASTAQLTAPSGKTTSDFTAGFATDHTNPLTVDIGSSKYTELEWNIQSTSAVSDTEVYQFRVTAGGQALATYSVTPQMTIGDVLPTVTTQSATNVGLTYTGHGTVTASGDQLITKRGFVYGTTSQSDPGNVANTATSYTSTVSDTGSWTTGSFSKDFTGLSSGSTYYARAFAQNASGYKYGSEVSFIAGNLPTVTTQAADTITGTSAKLHGTVTDDGDLTIDQRGFVYGTSSQSLPGNVPPGSSGYSNYVSEDGTYGETSFERTIGQ